MLFKSSIVAMFAAATLVAGHGAIVKAVGDQGGAGSAIGVDPATPRDGTRRNPFQQDSTRFKGDNAATCGQTLGVRLSHCSIHFAIKLIFLSRVERTTSLPVPRLSWP
jgi:hypothetical protein